MSGSPGNWTLEKQIFVGNVVFVFLSPNSEDVEEGLVSVSPAKERISSNVRRLLRRRFSLSIENLQGSSHLDAAFQSMLQSGASGVSFCGLLDPRNAPWENNSVTNWTRHAVHTLLGDSPCIWLDSVAVLSPAAKKLIWQDLSHHFPNLSAPELYNKTAY